MTTSILIDISTQLLYLYNAHHEIITHYSISSAKNGLGNRQGSEKTPLGLHTIYKKIGDNMPIFTIFHARQSTGEQWNHALSQHVIERDLILSRILWLQGDETSLDRYIYIHGTNDEKNIGKPCSHGCIRMRNLDVIDLFDRVHEGDTVLIKENI